MFFSNHEPNHVPSLKPTSKVPENQWLKDPFLFGSIRIIKNPSEKKKKKRFPSIVQPFGDHLQSACFDIATSGVALKPEVFRSTPRAGKMKNNWNMKKRGQFEAILK